MRCESSMPESPSCIMSAPPRTKDVSFTNYCDITARVVRGKVLVLQALGRDLIKGACESLCRTST